LQTTLFFTTDGASSETCTEQYGNYRKYTSIRNIDHNIYAPFLQISHNVDVMWSDHLKKIVINKQHLYTKGSCRFIFLVSDKELLSVLDCKQGVSAANQIGPCAKIGPLDVSALFRETFLPFLLQFYLINKVLK
jgi:hypothetical protein